MSLLVRNLAAQDLDEVLVLAAGSLEAPHWNRRDYEQILLADPSDPLLRCGLVADSGGKVAGFAVASWLRHEVVAEVEGLFVELDCRRRGVMGAAKWQFAPRYTPGVDRPLVSAPLTLRPRCPTEIDIRG